MPKAFATDGMLACSSGGRNFFTSLGQRLSNGWIFPRWNHQSQGKRWILRHLSPSSLKVVSFFTVVRPASVVSTWLWRMTSTETNWNKWWRRLECLEMRAGCGLKRMRKSESTPEVLEGESRGVVAMGRQSCKDLPNPGLHGYIHSLHGCSRRIHLEQIPPPVWTHWKFRLVWRELCIKTGYKHQADTQIQH